jgi:CRP/FNR family transcriptional regulator, cyclic AMP receptor protein
MATPLARQIESALEGSNQREELIMNSTAETATNYVHDLIVSHPFCKGLNPHYLHLLADCASLMRFGVGQDIFREGQDADHFYLIHTGRVALETFVPRAGATTIQTLEAGEALGWSWLFAPHQWQFTARALEPVEAVAFGAASLRENAEENHDFGYELLTRVGHVMLQRLQATRRRLIEFYVHDIVE